MERFGAEIRITDNITGPVLQALDALTRLLNVLDRTDGASTEAEAALHAVGDAIDALKGAGAPDIADDMEDAAEAAEDVRDEIEDAAGAADGLGRSVGGVTGKATETQSALSKWEMALTAANAALNIVQNTIGRITGKLGLTDFEGAFGRMDTMSQFQRTIGALSGDTEAANGALEELKTITRGTAYGLDTAAQSAQNFYTRGMSLEDSTQLVRVWSDAVAFYGKGTSDQLANVTDAMGKMYSKGKVEMQQLDRLTDAGINAVGLYADATGQSVAQVQQDLSKGEISAGRFLSVVTKALNDSQSSGAARNAGASWAATFDNTAAAAKRGWISVIESMDSAIADLDLDGITSLRDAIAKIGSKTEQVLNRFASSGATAVFARIFAQAIPLAQRLVAFLEDTADMIAKNGPTIEAVTGGIMNALEAMLVIMNAVFGLLGMGLGGLNQHAEAISKIVTALTILGAIIIAVVLAVKLWTLAQSALSVAMNTTFIIPILIAAAVVALIVGIAWLIRKFTGETTTMLESIVGVVSVIGAAIWNLVVALINEVIQIIWTLFIEPFMGINEWILNVMNGGFNSFGDAVKNLIGNIISWFLSLGKVVTKVIDAIFGTDWTSGLNDLQDSVLSWGKNENAVTIDRKAPTVFNRIDYADAYNWGVDKGSKIQDTLSQIKDGILSGGSALDLDSLESLGVDQDALDSISDSSAQTADNTRRIADATDELRYLREIAERASMQNVTNATITVNASPTIQTTNTEDIDAFVDALTEGMALKLAAAV